MIHPKSLFKMSAMTKTSPSFWPAGVAIGISTGLNTIIVLVHTPDLGFKLMMWLFFGFASVMVYKWSHELYNNR